MKNAIYIILFLSFFCANAQKDKGRTKISINENWLFYKGEMNDAQNVNHHDQEWEKVHLPHTWNSEDPFDEKVGYYRGDGWYRKRLHIRKEPSKRYFLYFEAANQVARVFINGIFIGDHTGGYTAFAFDITDHVNSGENVLAVQVNNEHNESIIPLRGDFNFYGGIYRDVFLVTTSDIHFNVIDYAGPGIKISTPKVDDKTAEVVVEGNLINESTAGRKSRVKIEIISPEKEVVAREEISLDLKNKKNTFRTGFKLKEPVLWSPDSPDLYTVKAVISADGEVKDQISQPLGLRYFRFDPDEGFFLNGKRVKLIGVNRHQDYPGLGNALSNERHLADIRQIKSMGANFLRTAHYPQDPAILEACDRLGLLVTMEIPLDHDIKDSPEFYQNSSEMMKEMIRQYYNHPSVIVWAYMNEMFLGRNFEKDGEYIKDVVAYAKVLEELTRKEDPYRYTMIPNHGDFDVYHKSGLTEIPMIVGWNLYYGWYEEGVDGFGKFVDRAHKAIPDKPIIITEYGAGSDSRIRSPEPVRFDFSLEWQNYFHHEHIKQILDRPHISGSAVWNMYDFGSENRRDAIPQMNNKGLCDFDRTPKDAYYIYKSYLSEEPFFKIIPVGGWPENEDDQQVMIISNQPSGEVYINGKSVGIKTFTDNVLHLNLSNPLVGVKVESPDRKFSDELSFQHETRNTSDYTDININLGTNFEFYDLVANILWEPASSENQPVKIIGGENYMPRNRGIGTDRGVFNTGVDPVFQTQIIGIESLHAAVDPGKYRITLYFAELENKEAGERVFNIYLNDKKIFNIDLSKDAGKFTAVQKVIEEEVSSDNMVIKFEQVKGLPVLGGISINKIY